MKSAIVKRSVTIGAHKTSISLEDAFCADLRKIAHAQGCALPNLIAKIDSSRKGAIYRQRSAFLYLNISARGPVLPTANEALFNLTTAH